MISTVCRKQRPSLHQCCYFHATTHSRVESPPLLFKAKAACNKAQRTEAASSAPTSSVRCSLSVSRPTKTPLVKERRLTITPHEYTESPERADSGEAFSATSHKMKPLESIFGGFYVCIIFICSLRCLNYISTNAGLDRSHQINETKSTCHLPKKNNSASK